MKTFENHSFRPWKRMRKHAFAGRNTQQSGIQVLGMQMVTVID